MIKLSPTVLLPVSRSVFVVHGLFRVHHLRELQASPHRSDGHSGVVDPREQPRVRGERGRSPVLPQRVRRVPDGPAATR
jgi:hypothetical protein